MLDRQKSWRLFIASIPLQALSIGSLAMLLSAMLWSAAPATLTVLDYTVYDTWLRHRATAQLNPSLTIVARDTVSEERFGKGIWDRGILAQLIETIHEADAAVVGVDHRLNQASPAQLGGAASDALFLEALRTASPVVLIHDAHATYHLDDIPASVVARVAEHALGDEIELVDTDSVLFGRSDFVRHEDTG